MDEACVSERVGIAARRRCDIEVVRVEKAEATITVLRRRRREARAIAFDGHRWRVARVLTGFEFAVADDLEAAGFRAFAPHGVRVALRSRVPGADRRERRSRDYPICPGYVFVGQPAGLLLARASHDRILGVIGGDDRRASDRLAETLASLNRFCLAGHFDDQRRPKGSPIRPGELVRICEGPFAGSNARVEAWFRELQLVVNLRLFGRTTRVKLAPGQVERIGV